MIGGVNSVKLASEFGTPLYLFDELSLRSKCAEFKTEFGRRYADTEVIYAAKAFINSTLVRLLAEEGVGLDVVSAGELSIARATGFPLDRVFLHGNNKSDEELKLALDWGVGRIVVDSFSELDRLDALAGERQQKPKVLLRLSPGIDPHTHQYIATGVIDSKFGFPMSSAKEAVARALAAPNLDVTGLHFHIGSLIHEVEPYEQSIERVLDFAAAMKTSHGFIIRELDIGGGFAIQYTREVTPPPVSYYAKRMVGRVIASCRELELALPRLIIEPGRAIVGRAGVALYKVGVIKEIPGIRCYASVDGGMGDNIRPALYGARYEAVVAGKMKARKTKPVTISGKFCESGDILIKDIELPPLASGDIIAIPSCGAYCLPLASNYNASLRPAVVLVREGKARLIRRRETFSDLTRHDIV